MVMETNWFDKYYDDSLRIRAICDDLDVSLKDSLLYNQIHIKLNDKKYCNKYFEKEKIEFYMKEIKPKISEYNDEKVEKAFMCARNKLNV